MATGPLPGVNALIDMIQVKKELDGTVAKKKVSFQEPVVEVPTLDLANETVERNPVHQKGIVKKSKNASGSRGGGVKASKEGEDRRLEKTANVPEFRDAKSGLMVKAYQLAPYNYKNIAMLGDVFGVKLENDADFFTPPCSPRHVYYTSFGIQKKKEVAFPSKITIKPEAYTEIVRNYISSSCRAKQEDKIIIANGPGHHNPAYSEVYSRAYKNACKRWGMMGYLRKDLLDNKDGEVWAMTVESWNQCAYNCQRGSRDSLPKYCAEKVYKAVATIVPED